MPDASQDVAQPLLWQGVPRSTYNCGRQVFSLVSLSISFGFAVLLSFVPCFHSKGGQRLMVQDSSITMAQQLQPGQAPDTGPSILDIIGTPTPSPESSESHMSPKRRRLLAESTQPAVHESNKHSESGKLTCWDDRGFGFIQPDGGGDDLFCHMRSLLNGEGSVQQGDQVTYKRKVNDRTGKPEAMDVCSASRGKVISWDDERGFGFIQPTGSDGDLFCHVRSLLGGQGSLKEGDLVTYQKEFNDRTKKYEAMEVRLLSVASGSAEGKRSDGATPKMDMDTECKPVSIPSTGSDVQTVEKSGEDASIPSGLMHLDDGQEKIDPDDGRQYAFPDFFQKHRLSFSEAEIKTYWDNECVSFPGGDMDTRKTDPDDGNNYSFLKLFQRYRGAYPVDEIKAYWKDECKPIGSGSHAQKMDADDNQKPVPTPDTGSDAQKITPDNQEYSFQQLLQKIAQKQTTQKPESIPDTGSDVQKIDPDDNQEYSYQKLLQKYTAHYTEQQIKDYWNDECKPVPDSKSDGVRRIDPESGKTYSYQELLQKYKLLYSEDEIKEYWNTECKPLETTAAPGSVVGTGAQVDSGTISRWNGERGFGFIQPNDGDEIFCHAHSLATGVGSVQQGDKVTYKKEFNERTNKYQAVDVHLAPGGRAGGGQSQLNSEKSSGFMKPGDNDIADSGELGSEAVAMVLEDPQSDEIYLDWKQLGDDGVAELAQKLPGFKKLTKLYLNNNGIGDRGVQSLAQVLPQVENLKYVYLRWNRIGNAGAQALASVLPRSQNLQFVDLTWNKIESTGVEVLDKLVTDFQNLKVEYYPQSDN